VSELAAQAPRRPPQGQQQQQSVEPLDVLAMAPENVQLQQQPSPPADDAADDKPSWLVQVGRQSTAW
jgi:hypothetical protein